MKAYLSLLGAMAGFVAVMLIVGGLPVAWFYGRGNAAFLRETQGLDLPWYEALTYPILIDLRDKPYLIKSDAERLR